MDKTILVNDDISEGKVLIERLDKTYFKVNSALWFYDTELQEWRFYLASDYLKEHTLQEAYRFIQDELKAINAIRISSDNISIVDSDDDLIKLIGYMMRTGEKDISDMRFSRNVINGVMVEDAVIYRINLKK